jgi:hypothetical protein
MSRENGIMTTERTYRGSTTYQLVYAKLVHAAQHQTHIFYADVADVLGPLGEDDDVAPEGARLLAEISEDEQSAGRPMLSALTVSGRGAPAATVFNLARRLGNLASTDPADEMAFWTTEKGRVYDTWKPPASHTS